MTDRDDVSLFPETPWSLIAQQAAAQDVDTAALKALLSKYWNPVFCTIRDSWHRSPLDARDLCDRFLGSLMTSSTLRQIDRRLAFRDFLKTKLVEFMQSDSLANRNVSSGIPIDVEAAFAAATGEPEAVFDTHWLSNVFDRALGRTRATLEGDNQALDVFITADVDGAAVGQLDESLAAALRRARMIFRHELTETVFDYVSDLPTAKQELRWLLG